MLTLSKCRSKVSNIPHFLNCDSIPPTLEAIAQMAIVILDGELVLNQGEGIPQSSAVYAKIYALRRDIGYFGKQKVYGLNETIALLTSKDREVSLSYIEVKKGMVLIWRDIADQSICGLLLIQSDS